MHTYKYHAKDRCYQVGSFDPAGKWCPLSEHDTAEAAATEAAKLNGADGAALDALLRKVEADAERECSDALAELSAMLRHANAQADKFRELLDTVVKGWDAAGCYGFVCRNQDGLISLTQAIQNAKDGLK